MLNQSGASPDQRNKPLVSLDPRSKASKIRAFDPKTNENSTSGQQVPKRWESMVPGWLKAEY